MTSIDVETRLIIIYVLVDDWYQRKGQASSHNCQTLGVSPAEPGVYLFELPGLSTV